MTCCGTLRLQGVLPSPLVIAEAAIVGQPERGFLLAALIKGSSGELGYIPSGGDVDLVLWVDGSVSRYAELAVCGIPVELFIRPGAELLDTEALLHHQAQPFDLIAGTVLRDLHGLIGRAREAVEARLCEPALVAHRAQSSANAARLHLAEAVSHSEAGEWLPAASAASLAVWHLAAIAPAGSCMRPTTRRCFALLHRLLLQRGRADLVDLAAQALLGPQHDEARLIELAALLRPADWRVPAAVAGMLEAGEGPWAAYPILRSAFRSDARHAPEVIARIARECGWEEHSLGERLGAAGRLLADLERIYASPRSSTVRLGPGS